MEKTFNIFTPTYNRKGKLKRTYESLKNQTFKDFTWLIIDDGSTDNTKEVVDEFKDLDIQYVYVKNGGKQRAYNLAIEKAGAKYFMCLDSDDYLVEDALEKIQECMKKTNSHQAGVGYLSGYDRKTVIGTKLALKDISIFSQYNEHNVSGDKGLCFKTDILKQYRFKVFEGEKFTTEAYLYNMISEKYTMYWINEIFEIKEYLDNGLTSKYDRLLCKNPKGQALYYNQTLRLKKSLLNASRYIKFSLIAKKSIFEIIREANSKLFAILGFPIGVYMYFKWRIKNEEK